MSITPDLVEDKKIFYFATPLISKQETSFFKSLIHFFSQTELSNSLKYHHGTNFYGYSWRTDASVNVTSLCCLPVPPNL